ncbi:DoxX family protein [Kaistella sp. 97-N-M2]|uniref:DoxX family protein n=1 Tax=Kaistella sp. 97-N-M2 TaxID=2908645 RepID=UPI001F390943|nr:DoxX family protein [Kaistella sp. 97-N-M2]UJF28873.1 DoxX family protein [Kaistella sp. 97-N-M2]
MKFRQLRRNKLNNWIIIHLRYLVGLAFLPSGMTKLIGHRFTNISTESPIGYFFEALYQSGFYWNFLGLAQITAGVLLLTQRYALLGTLLFAAILTNVWLITLSLSFKGTWIITSLMMIAVILLLIWDHQKLLPIVSRKKNITIESFPEPGKIWVTAGIIYSVLFLILSVLNPLMGETSRVVTLILVGLIVLTFTGSNFISYKSNRKIFHTPL